MWEKRKILILLKDYIYSTTSPVEIWQRGCVNSAEFIRFLTFKKRYQENWKDTLISIFHLRLYNVKQSLLRAKKQRDNIVHVLRICIKEKYIETEGSGEHEKLKISLDGYEFIKMPVFINSLLFKYDKLFLVLGSILGTMSAPSIFKLIQHLFS